MLDPTKSFLVLESETDQNYGSQKDMKMSKYKGANLLINNNSTKMHYASSIGDSEYGLPKNEQLQGHEDYRWKSQASESGEHIIDMSTQNPYYHSRQHM